TTRHRPWDGARWARATRERTSSMEMVTRSVATSVTSACVPARAVRHSWHVPQPPAGHCRAAAKARAAMDRPEPGGPVTSQAWVMAEGSATAPRSTSTAAGWPTTSSQTLTATPSCSGASLGTRQVPAGAHVHAEVRRDAGEQLHRDRLHGLGAAEHEVALRVPRGEVQE